MMTPADVTMVKDAIHNPADARHFMRLKPLSHPVAASAGGTQLVNTGGAVRVQEAGRDLYDPVVYFRRDSIPAEMLRKTEKTTHCPLKGDTEYYDVLIGGRVLSNAAWSYVRTLDFDPRLDDLRGRIAFDAYQVQVTEHTAVG